MLSFAISCTIKARLGKNLKRSLHLIPKDVAEILNAILFLGQQWDIDTIEQPVLK